VLQKGQSNSPQSTSTITPSGSSSSSSSTSAQKRLHVSNIPFRFRDDDLKAMFEVNIFVLFEWILFVFCFVAIRRNCRYGNHFQWTWIESMCFAFLLFCFWENLLFFFLRALVLLHLLPVMMLILLVKNFTVQLSKAVKSR